jgi:coenzyme PQQ precursor peptide PqqA
LCLFINASSMNWFMINDFLINHKQFREKENTMWTQPQATEMRFGFEVTMYVMNK